MREAALLRQRYRAILAYTGLVVALCAALMLTPLMALLVWPEESYLAWHFGIPASLMGGLGIAAWRLLRPRDHVALTTQEGGVIVLLSWLTVCLWSAWPFFFGHGLGLTQALFEAVSGWTTTGLSVVDVTETSHAILLWRSIMQLAGGAGLAIIMLSAITGPTGPALSSAEGREQLVPNVRQSARLVLTIYTGYTLVGVVALLLAGMSWFDAVNHAFCAVSTGGFSTRPDSIGHWDSTVVEAVTLPLMVLGNLSFMTAWLLMHRRFRAAARNGEVRLFVLLVPLCIALLFLLTCRGLYPSLGKGLRVAIFETVTALTTTGYSTVGYGNWNAFGWIVLIVLMVIGGGTCATAGGIKQYRVYLLWKSIVWEVRRALAPRGAVLLCPAQEGDREVFVSEQRLRQIGTFVFLYLLTLTIGTAVMTAYGYGLKESAFEYASTIGTVGLSVGVTSADTPPAVLWVQIIGMLLGRLEFFVILASAAKIVRDGSRMVARVPPIR
ncbi:MAG TPA: TrkH family potassium uptake protein [Phycisphaerae bacterium]|nr:TrkH family potassium uptake protein [Phycisphaerae bacterium]